MGAIVGGKTRSTRHIARLNNHLPRSRRTIYYAAFENAEGNTKAPNGIKEHLVQPIVTLLTFAQVDSTTPAAAKDQSGLSPSQVTHLIETYGLPAAKAIALLIIGYLIAGWVTKLVTNACRRAKLDETLAKFLGNFARWLVLTAVVITCLSSFGVQVTSLVAILGSVGVAIGLALQGSLSHIASGVMLLIFRPFKVGDFVTAGGQTGIVNEISLFSTYLTTPDNRIIIVPNGAIVGGVIINSTANTERMVEVQVATNPASGVEPARALLLKTANNIAGKLPDKPAGCGLISMGAANTFNVTLWCKTTDLDATKERLMIACNAAIAEAQFAPPAPIALVKNV